MSRSQIQYVRIPLNCLHIIVWADFMMNRHAAVVSRGGFVIIS
jgi:hypothetical protein